MQRHLSRVCLAQGDEAASKGERTMTKQWHRRARRTTCTIKPCSIIKTDIHQRSYSPRNMLNTNMPGYWAENTGPCFGVRRVENKHWHTHIPNLRDRNSKFKKKTIPLQALKGSDVCLAPLVDSICACVRSFLCRPLQQCCLSPQFAFRWSKPSC